MNYCKPGRGPNFGSLLAIQNKMKLKHVNNNTKRNDRD